MKGIMRKALSLVMMLAMVAGIIAVPNVDAKAADKTTKIVVILSEALEEGGKVLLDFDGQNAGMSSTGAVDTSVGWGRDMWTFTKESDTRYSITVTGTVGESNYCNMQFLLCPASGGYSSGHKYYPQDDRNTFLNNDTLYFTIDNSNTGWPTLTASTTDPEAATAADVMAVIDAIGTVELSDECKTKIDAARTAYDNFTGNKDEVTNYNVLTAAETTWAGLLSGAAGKVTFYVKSADWEAMYAYVTDLDWNYTVAWPGTQLTELELNPGWYSCSFDIEGPANIIFNNNDGSQTSDWKYVKAGTYWVEIAADKSYETSYEAPTGWKTEEAEDLEIVIPSIDGDDEEGTTTTPSTTDKYQQKYTSAQLVGNFAALKDKLKNCKITSDWDVAGDAGNMEYLGNGVYAITLTFDKTTEDVVLEYKVAFNHSWDVSIGLQSVDTAFTTNNGGNIKVTIPAGSTSFKIIASEKDTVVYDSIQNAAEVAQYEEIAKMADSSLFVLYVVILVAGCAMVAVASKKRFAK